MTRVYIALKTYNSQTCNILTEMVKTWSTFALLSDKQIVHHPEAHPNRLDFIYQFHKAMLQCLVEYFNQPIGLRMISRGNSVISLKLFKKVFIYSIHEFPSQISYNNFCTTMSISTSNNSEHIMQLPCRHDRQTFNIQYAHLTCKSFEK